MDNNLATMDAGQLRQYINAATTRINEYTNLFQKALDELIKTKSIRIEALKQEETWKLKVRQLKERISATKEEIKSAKILLRAETATMSE